MAKINLIVQRKYDQETCMIIDSGKRFSDIKFLAESMFPCRNILIGLNSWAGRFLTGVGHPTLEIYASLVDPNGPGFFGDIYRRITGGRLRPIGSCRAAYSVRARADPGSTPTKDRFTACPSSNRHRPPNRNTNPNFHTCSRSYLHAPANLHSLPNIHTFTHSYFISHPGPTNRSRGNHPHAIACDQRDTAFQPKSHADSSCGG